MHQGEADSAARLSGIWKSFGAVPVLKGVDMTLHAGRVHAVLGGNGAGKSTLMKILAGLEAPDRGVVEIGGEPLPEASPARAQSMGLYLVPQEAHILPNRSVFENVSLGLREGPRVLRGRIMALVSELGVALDLDAAGGSLEIADRQIVEILRGLVRRARVLVLDEPTSALTPREVASLLERVRVLRDGGVAIVFISHKLREIREFCDTISVLRDGVTALEGRLEEVGDPEIIVAMSRPDTEGKLDRRAPAEPKVDAPPFTAPEGCDAALRVDGLSGEGFRDVNLFLQPGEVLGLAGVVGAGRTELAETVFGLRAATSGRVMLQGREIVMRSPRRCIDAGLVYLPEDRQRNGLFLDAPLRWNVTSYLTHRLPILPRATHGRALFETFRNSMGIRCTGPEQIARRLSGGNQQKVLLAKCLAPEPAVLILDEPTRGVDVGARGDIYALVTQLAARGVAILLISSDFEEIARLADRVMVMAFGVHTGTLERQGREPIREAAIARLAFGASAAGDA